MKHLFPILFALLAIIGLPSTVWANIHVALLDEVEVVGPFVRLGDLADVSGTDWRAVESARAVFCGKLSAEGEAKTISRFYLTMRLVQSGFAPEEITWAGVRAVWVRPVDRPESSEAKPIPGSRVAKRGRGQSPVSVERKRALLEVAKRYVLDKLKTADNDTVISLKRFETDPATLPKGKMRIVGIKEFGAHNMVGTVKFYVKVSVDKHPVQRILIALNVKPYYNAVVANTALPAGHKVRREDVRVERKVRWKATGPQPVGAVDRVVGKKLVRPVQAGEPIYPHRIESRRPVERGAVVDVIVIRNGVRLTLKGRARSSGGIGDTVEVSSPKNFTKPITAKVVGLNRVEDKR